jgi:PAS domain S-box-containing protein
MSREQLLRELDAARGRCEALYDLAPVAYVTLDLEGGVLELNPAGAELLGLQAPPPPGTSLVSRIPEEEAMALRRHLHLCAASGCALASELRLTLSGREPRDVHVISVPVHDRSGQVSALRSSLTDVTSRRRTEEALANERLSEELEVMTRLHALATLPVEGDPSSVLDAIVQTALALAGADKGLLQLCDLRTGALHLQAHHGFDALMLERCQVVEPGDRTVCGLALTARRRVIIEDIAVTELIDERVQAMLLDEGVRTVQATPLTSRSGQILGVLSTHSLAARPLDALALRRMDLLAQVSADLLEQRRLVQELRETDRLHRAFLATIADPVIIVDKGGTIAYANVQAEKVFGYEEGELAGQSHDLLVPERLRALHAKYARQFLLEPTSRSMHGTRPLFGRRKDGSEFPIEASLNPLTTPSGLMVSSVVRDISQRQAQESAAQLHAQQLESAIESIPDAVAVWDAEDRMLACNAAFRQLAEELVPGPLLGVSTADLRHRVAEILVFQSEESRERFVREPTLGSTELHLSDGRRLRATTRDMPGGGRVVVAIDLTQELMHQTELEDARTEAEAASRAKSEFLASMSHELRTPLNAVLGFCQLLQRDRREPLTERQRGMVDQVYRSGEHLLHLIDDVLDLARIEANKVSITFEPVSACDAITSTLEALEPAARDAEIYMWFEQPSLDPPSLHADPRRLVQILMNFGSNAIKYNRPGGKVSFSVSQHGRCVRISVTDTGRGIAAEHQKKLFQPFQRAGQETGPVEGTGIGLAISKRLVELMLGRVGFESVPGQGSTFWVELPTHVTRAGPRSTPPPAMPRTLAVRRAVVLYVEDNPSSVSFMRNFMSGVAGVDLVTAKNAEMGMAMVSQHRPDLILMDINLPGMSGLEALRLLQASPATRDIPVVALSAAASDSDRLRGQSAGFRRYLTKPVRVEDLEKVLEELLSRRG